MTTDRLTGTAQKLIRLPRLVLLCALVAPLSALAAGCPPKCTSVSSVVHAAGVPTGVAQAVDRLSFEGNTLKEADATVKELVAAIKALPPNAVVALKVGADDGLSGAAAKRQATARAAALRTALTQGGVPARRVTVTPQ